MKKVFVSILFLVFFLSLFSHVSSFWYDDDYHYGKGYFPRKFYKGDHYPTNEEDLECRPIKIRIARGTKRFKDLVTFPRSYSYLHFATDDCRTMSSRLHTRLSCLSKKYYQKYYVKLLILKAWTPFPDHSLDNTSLHYEGRSIQIHVTRRNVTKLLRLAALECEFDWVTYDWKGYARLSVIPDACDANLDVVFVMDQSGSVGRYNHNIALQFLQRVVDFFNIGSNQTQVGLITYSTHARVRFDLNDFDTKADVLNQISRVQYPGGWTATALGLFQAGVILNPNEQRGARPISEGVPRVVILLTDGRSNRVPIDEVVPALHNFGIQVYTVGIGNVYLPELKFIASDPDPYHIFLLDSFSDAAGFVDFLSSTTCDTPAVVEPGENTTTEVPEDGFRFFQTECTAFSVSVVIEQIDIYGKCNLYASTLKPNPGPLDNSSIVVKNEDLDTDRRIVVLRGVKKFIYISIRGVRTKNMFTVIIWDRIFRLEEYTVNAPEGIANHPFFNLTQEVTVTTEIYYFRIKEGNDNNDFQIDNMTGILSTANELSISRQQYYRLLIVVENRNASCHRGKVIINVCVVPSQLEFVNVRPVNITEGATGNVTRVTAMGAGGGDTLRYSITGGNVGNAFAINETTGDIRVIGTLDFETTRQYRLTIQARTNIGATASTVQIINILDLNERPFFVTLCARTSSCNFNVFENSPSSTLVGRILAMDPDNSSIPNGTLSYSLSPSSFPFTINSNGNISVSGALDRENRSTYFVTVGVADNGSPSLAITSTVRITILDRNDNAPRYVSGNRQLSIPENTPLNRIIQQYVFTDSDIGNNAIIRYSLQSDISNLPFAINSTSGHLRVSGPLDFDRGLRQYQFTLRASNPDGLSTSINITIQITDVNDNTPQFVTSPITANVTEHSPVGTQVTRVQATDIDSGLNGTIEYSLIIAVNLFVINNNTGVITVNGDIDREMVTMFSFLVRAQDLGSPNRLSNITNITIIVNDINDNAPIFLPNNLTLTIPENRSLGALLDLTATDRDQPGTPNSAITYSILSGNINNHFAINSSTGVLSLVRSLDFEERRSFTLTIQGEDGGTPRMNGTATVNIIVTNVNDHPPVISGNVTVSVPEDTSTGTRLAQFNATDLDQMSIHFTLTHPNGSRSFLFAINRDTGIVTLIGRLDFEAARRHVLNITASDGVHIDQATLTVNVLDVNEFNPVFISPAQFRVNESEPNGTILGTVRARDGDTSDQITYFLMPNNTIAGLFRLNSTTGVLSTGSVLDREGLVEENHFLPPGSREVLTVMAIDNGQNPGPRRSFQNITITLNDINDNRPMFNASMYEDTIPENVNGTTPLFTALATDADLGINAVIRYSLSSNVQDSFSINATTGLVSAIRLFDRENPRNVFSFFITARDLGNPSLSSNASARVRVTDLNDNSPMFEANDDYELEVPENRAVGRVVTQIRVVDIDQGNNAVINITSRENSTDCPIVPTSSSPCFFSVDNFGIVRIQRPLDYETQSQHNITLIATDNGNPSRSTTQLLIINIINIDERGPEFIDSCNATVLEGVPRGTLVIECEARDFDEVVGQFTNLVTYAIIGGSGQQVFAIERDSGNVTTNGELDRERVASYSITIQATDRGGLRATTVAVITVGDINDNTPELDGPYSVTISDSDLRSYRSAIVTVSASDDDAGNNAVIDYSIEDDDISDQETILTISATDRGSPDRLSDNTTVNVTFESPCTSQSYSINSQTGVITGRFLCQINITPALIQVNVGDSFSLSCNVLRNVDVQVQFLHNVSTVGSPTALTRGESTATFTQDNVTFDNAGFYGCRAENIQTSQSSQVQVQVPPVITTAPRDAAINLGVFFFRFTCIANIGVPTPVITWRKDGALVQGSNRVRISGNMLIIGDVERDDQGDYTCVATNRAGNDTATANLRVIALGLVFAEGVTMSNPDPILNCNTFDKQQFEKTMTQITNHRTMVTNTQGTSLCPSDACHPSPCVNGTCNVTSSGYQCTCTPGFMGQNCDQDIDECQDTTCQNGGTCQNVPGGFKCHCTDDYYGDLCSYSHSKCKCPPGADCSLTDGGYRCIVTATSSHVTINEPTVTNIVALDNAVNTLLEDPPSSSRRKRSGFVTVCSGRFVQLSSSSSRYLLAWVCPDGVKAPDDDKLTQICRSLVYSQLVRVCYPPGNTPPVRLTDVPPSDLDITLVLFDSNGNIISSQEAMNILASTDALYKMSQSGFNISRFHHVQEPDVAAHSSLTARNIGGSIGGVLGALLVIIVIVLIVIGAMKYRKRNKRIRVPVIELNEKGTTLRNTMIQQDDDEDRYSRVPVSSLPSITDTSLEYSTVEKVATSGPTSPLRSPTNPYTLFDDPVYTTNTKAPSSSRKSVKRSTLERAKQHHLQKSSSLEKLLDGEDDDSKGDTKSIQSSLEDGDEPIYGNMNYVWEGKAGDRWENYWKSSTVLRGTSPPK